MKKALRETQTLRALAVVRFGHRPPARCHKPTDRTDYNTLHRSSLALSVIAHKFGKF